MNGFVICRTSAQLHAQLSLQPRTAADTTYYHLQHRQQLIAVCILHFNTIFRNLYKLSNQSNLFGKIGCNAEWQNFDHDNELCKVCWRKLITKRTKSAAGLLEAFYRFTFLLKTFKQSCRMIH